MIRRGPVIAAILAVGIGGLAAEANAQSYPARPIRYIVHSSAGSGSDHLARLMANELPQMLGQQIIVDNRAGAAGNIGAEVAAKAPPDGYTMLQVSITLAINASFYRQLSYDLQRDFSPVTLMVIQPNILVVHASLPVRSVKDLIALAKARPGALNYGSSGVGANSFLATELFKSLTGTSMAHVPYKGGGPAMVALLTGETSLMFAPIASSLPHLQQGRLRGLAVTSSARVPTLPQYPAVAETIPGYEFNNWYGMVVPARTPAPVIGKLHGALTGALKRPSFEKQLSDVGYIPVGNSPEAFGAFIRAEIAKVAKTLRQTGAVAN